MADDKRTSRFIDREVRFMKTLDSKNFDKYSLDNFMRHQQVRECSRNVDGR